MTNTHNELLGLAERVEGATGPDRELDAQIAVALLGFYVCEPRYPGEPTPRYGYVDKDGCRVEPGNGGDMLVKRFTSSLDAAMSLADGLDKFGGASGMLRQAMDNLSAPPVMVSTMTPAAYREALARFFTAACLRAHASLREGTGR